MIAQENGFYGASGAVLIYGSRFHVKLHLTAAKDATAKFRQSPAMSDICVAVDVYAQIRRNLSTGI